MVVIKPKLKSLPVWQQVIEVSGNLIESELKYIDQLEDDDDDKGKSLTVKASDTVEKHRSLYKWYGDFDDITNLANLYFPNNDYTANKLYGLTSAELYLRYRAYRSMTRTLLATVIPIPYSVTYNDSVLVFVTQVKPFDYSNGYNVNNYEYYNDQLEYLSLLEGFVLIYDYVVHVLYNDHWVLITLDSFSIMLVCIVYSKGLIVALYVYVVGTISIDEDLGCST
jgi:hypothetical protein